MMKDCSGTPLASYSVRLWYKAPSSLYKSKDLGTATTDADGNFTIDSIPFGHTVGLYLIGKEGNTWYNNFDVPVSDPGQVYDLGTFYSSLEKTAIVKLNINLPGAGPNDSLYIGNPGAYQVLYPIPASALLVFTGGGYGRVTVNFHDTYPMYWGINKRGVDSIFNHGAHLLRPAAGICQNPDTSVIAIP